MSTLNEISTQLFLFVVKLQEFKEIVLTKSVVTILGDKYRQVDEYLSI